MQVLLELQLDLLVNMLLIRFSTHAPEVATNKNTNNRIFGGNTGNFLLGAVGGFAAASVAHAAAGSPCGR